jgi:hypothetical protein
MEARASAGGETEEPLGDGRRLERRRETVRRAAVPE